MNVCVYYHHKTTYRCITHSLSVLGWYIPGLSELPRTWESLHFITCRTFPADLCVLHFSWRSRFFFPFFLIFRFVCVRVLVALHCGRARRRRGYQRVLVGREVVETSAVAVFVPRRRVCLETQGKHEWTLPGLLVWFRLYYVRVYNVRFDMQNKVQAVLIFAKKPKTTERATQSEHQLCRAGERGPRLAPGFMRGGRRGSLWQGGREALPGSNRLRNGRERGGRRMRLREKCYSGFLKDPRVPKEVDGRSNRRELM